MREIYIQERIPLETISVMYPDQRVRTSPLTLDQLIGVSRRHLKSIKQLFLSHMGMIQLTYPDLDQKLWLYID